MSVNDILLCIIRTSTTLILCVGVVTVGKMKPASRKFKNQGSGVYRKQLHGWGMVEARQQVKHRKAMAGKKIHQEGPKEYRINVPRKRVNPKAKISPRPKLIIEQADPWLGTKPMHPTRIRQELNLKNVPLWNTKTGNKKFFRLQKRADLICTGMPQAVRKQVFAVLIQYSKSRIMSKNRIRALAFMVWHSISKIHIIRFVGIAGITYRLDDFKAYLREARDLLQYDLTDQEIDVIHSEFFSHTNYDRKRNFKKSRRAKAATATWREVRTNEIRRQSAKRIQRKKDLRKVFLGLPFCRRSRLGRSTPQEKKAKRKASLKRWQQKHKEHLKQYHQEYRIKNKAKLQEAQRKRREENPEFFKARNKRYNSRRTPEQKKRGVLCSKRWRKAHPENVKEYNRKQALWRKNNPEKVKAYNRKANAKRRSAKK